MTINEFIDVLPRAAAVGPTGAEVSGMADDSRRVGAGDVFVAVRGVGVDGHEFTRQAMEAGAVAVVAEDRAPADLKEGVAWVMVPDSREALGLLANRWHGNPSSAMRVAGVTGTNGKTTTAFLLHGVMSKALYRAGLVGTIHFDDGMSKSKATHTTPGVLEMQDLLGRMRDNGCQAVAMEVSSHAIDQGRVSSVLYNTAIFTNLSQDHLDYHGTMDRYFEAKKALFLQMAEQPGGKTPVAVVNRDDHYGEILAKDLDGVLPVVTFGFGVDCDFRAGRVRQTKAGTEFQLEASGKSFLVRMPLFGRFNIYNALGVLAAAASIRIPLRDAVASLAEVPQVPGRLERVEGGDGFRVFVDYAHTPDALENACSTLKELEPRRLVTVFGCGGDRDRSKRPLMGKAASRLSDFCIITSDNPRSEAPEAIIADAAKGMVNTHFETIPDRAKAIERAVEICGEGDVILIAGKGHEDYQEFSFGTVPFDDRREARRALMARKSARDDS